MVERTLHIVAYDITDPRRLRRALIAVRTYACGGQKSVHECYLTEAERHTLRRKLSIVIAPATDSLLILRLDPRSRPRTLGIARPPADGRILYIG